MKRGSLGECLVVAFVALFTLTTGWCGFSALGAVDYLPLADVKPGMEGIGKTVVAGNVVETFMVRIIDVVDNPGPYDWILARVSGGAITRSGGVASGMSGSPVYVDGKLVGGLRASALWQRSDEPLVWLTPAESMLSLVDLVTRQTGGASAAADSSTEGSVPEQGPWLGWGQGETVAIPVTSFTREIRELRFVRSTPSDEELFANPSAAYVLDLCPAPVVGGLTERSLSLLESGVPRALLETHRGKLLPGVGPEYLLTEFLAAVSRGIGPVAAAASSERLGAAQDTKGYPAEFVAGGPMGALLMGGDSYYGWIGTVTFTDEVILDGQPTSIVVGLAHSLLDTGRSEYILNPIAILDTVQGINRSWKVGVPVGIPAAPVVAGVVSWDANPGLAAVVGKEPRLIRLNVTVEDLDRPGVKDSYSFDIVPMKDRLLYPLLTLIAGYDAVYTTLGRVGAGTMWLDYTIKGHGLPRDIRREDVFVANDDIGLLGPLQVARVAYLLAWNEFAEVQITEISMEMRVTSGIRTAIVEVVETEERIYSPGENVSYACGLRTYHGGQTVVRGSFTLPLTFREGLLTIVAIPEAYLEQLIAYGQHGWMRPMGDVWKFADLIDQIENSAKGDTMWVFVLELGCPYIDCGNEAERSKILRILTMGELGLEGAVTGCDTVGILVLPNAAR